MAGTRITRLAIPAMAILALVLLSAFADWLDAATSLLAHVGVAAALIAWRYSTRQPAIARSATEPPTTELATTEQSAGALDHSLLVFYCAWLLALIALWYFPLPQLLPALCAVWILRRELCSPAAARPCDTRGLPVALRRIVRGFAGCLSLYLLVCTLMFVGQRSLLYVPSQNDRQSLLQPWRYADETLGYCREVPDPQTVWLMMHGNAGQAAGRDYVLPHLAENDALYVLEYPGYGKRPGHPSRRAFDQAAAQAYRILRERFATSRLCVIGESIGSGPASTLTGQPQPPDKLVLIVPFDSLEQVVARKFPWLPVQTLLRDKWNNVEALKDYRGPVDIYAALEDEVIPVRHAQELARAIPTSRLIEIRGRHNDWSRSKRVAIR